MVENPGSAAQALVHIIESASVPIIAVDVDRRVTAWNSGAERMFGREKSAILGQAFLDAVEPVHRDELGRCLAVALRGETARGSIAVRSPGNEAVGRVSISAFALRDPGGAVDGAVVIGLDTGDNLRGPAGLETIVQGIAHRFNNINASVQGLLELVLMEPGISPITRERITEALGDLHRSTEITHRLLLIGTGSPTPPEPLRLDRLLATLLPFIERDLRSRGVCLEVLVEETPPILASPWQVNILLNALIDNAADATLGCPERRVVVGSCSRRDGVLLSVTDSGCGIAAADLPRIFMPFFTGKGEFAPSGSPQASTRGVGLSLALCHRIVHEMSGRIDVESTPGKGTYFRIVFPVH